MHRLTRLANLTRERERFIDRHPLARPDGGWYPGKRFDPTDILTDPRNWTVWKQFFTFFGLMLLGPVGTFIVIEWILRWYFEMIPQRSQTIAALVAVIALQGIMFTFAKLAFTEEVADYADEHKAAEAAAAAKLAAQDGAKDSSAKDSAATEAGGEDDGPVTAADDKNDAEIPEPPKENLPTEKLPTATVEKAGADSESGAPASSAPAAETVMAEASAENAAAGPTGDLRRRDK